MRRSTFRTTPSMRPRPSLSIFRATPPILRRFFPSSVSGAYYLVLVLAAIWLAGPFLQPIAVAQGWISSDQPPVLRPGRHCLSDLLALILHAAYSKVCHQLPERSLWIQGHPMAVCARCLGIYLGYFAGLLVYPLIHNRLELRLPSPRWLIVACMPIAIDFLGGYSGLFQNSLASRITTGLIAGFAGSVYTATGLVAATQFVLAAICPWRSSLPLGEHGGSHNV